MYRLDETRKRLIALKSSGNPRGTNFADIAKAAAVDEVGGSLRDKVSLQFTKLRGIQVLSEEEVNYAEQVGRGYAKDGRRYNEINDRHP